MNKKEKKTDSLLKTVSLVITVATGIASYKFIRNTDKKMNGESRADKKSKRAVKRLRIKIKNLKNKTIYNHKRRTGQW